MERRKQSKAEGCKSFQWMRNVVLLVLAPCNVQTPPKAGFSPPCLGILSLLNLLKVLLKSICIEESRAGPDMSI